MGIKWEEGGGDEAIEEGDGKVVQAEPPQKPPPK